VLAVGHGAREFWVTLSVSARRRLALAVGVVAAIVLFLALAVPALPCEAPGGDVCPPADDAVHLVPNDALVYVHLNVDPDTEQFKQAHAVAARVPTISQQIVARLVGRLPGPNGNPPDFTRDIEPWFGGEAAIALVPVGAGAAEEIQLLEVSNHAGAQRFADSIATGKPQKASYRDVSVQVDRRGLATAQVGGFLAIGRDSGVRDVIDAHSGAKGTGSLADDSAASAARGALPGDRLADVYMSKAGIARLVSNPRGPLTTLASVIGPGSSRGAAMALMATDQGLDVDVRSELDPHRAKTHPGFFAAFPRFHPAIAGSLPSGSLGYVEVGDPGATLKSLLEQASAEEPGLAAAVGDLVKSLNQKGNVDLEAGLLPALGGAAAFALEPTAAGQTDGGQGSQSPYLLFLGTGIHGSNAAQALSGLETPIAKALNPGTGGQSPAFTTHKLGGVTTHSLEVSLTVELTYALASPGLVVATNPAGVAQIVRGGGGLGGVGLYKQATGGLPGDVSVLGYLNLEGLIALGERAGLAEDPAYATFAPEIRKFEALGLAVQSSDAELSTDLRVIIGQASAPQAGGRVPSD
jgi:Protein of unknown function (DUF3352)